MKIDTKYNVGDKFYTMISNKIKEISIKKMVLQITGEDSIYVEYFFNVWFVDSEDQNRRFIDENIKDISFDCYDLGVKFFENRNDLIKSL